jgi:hypothetical protein
MELEAAKKNVGREVVYVLDLFDGKLSLNDVLNTDIPFLNTLKKCKEEAIDRSRQKNSQLI